eukprot:GHVR01156027.1.p1 GENE.GHVR01156027.1~~GHVR01156027.1.p1  ORF type:complete len:317 (+),score=84.54 GHVR01156027.1:184-1134(+)
MVKGESFYVVCDSSWGIGKFDRELQPFSPSNFEIFSPDTAEDKEDSQWEALVYDDRDDVFFMIQEAVEVDTTNHGGKQKKEHFHAIVQEAKIEKSGGELKVTEYKKLRECVTEKVFPSGNKGFEGAVGLRSKSGSLLILALCEGNYCEGGNKGRQVGNGRLVLMEKKMKKKEKKDKKEKKEKKEKEEEEEEEECVWETLSEIKIPAEANFVDYSGVAVRGDTIAIVSQESSALWLGKIELDEDGSVDPKEVKVKGPGKVYYFPRDDDCRVVYCNIEGIDFVNDNTIVAVSDKMKGGGRQDFRCAAKDQSIHIFHLP